MSSHQHVAYTRNPMYVFYAVAAGALYTVCWLIASRSNHIGFLEESVFNLIYGLPGYLFGSFVLVLMVGIFSITISVVAISLIWHRYDILTRTLVAVATALTGAVLSVVWVQREGPVEMLPNITPRTNFESAGFPSVIMAIVTAGALTLSLYTPSRYRRWISYGLVGVGASLIFLAISLPVDIVGGYTVGLFSFSICSLAFGSVYHPINTKDLTRRLRIGGLTGATLRPAAVDARGSVPFFGTYDGKRIFVKVFNQDNNAADWLFKLVRRLRYRRLEDEVPSLTPKRAIEHEAYITMLAKYQAGVRVPEIIGIFRVAHNSYAMVTERIDAKGLDSMDKGQITDKMLEQVWEQIMLLHSARIIHKDLRAANIMIGEYTKLPWVIDFGFSESAISKASYYKDNVEFIASSSTKVGAQRAVRAAYASIGQGALKRALPYMQYAALSGATTTALKQQRGLLGEVRAEMLRQSRASTSDLKKARMKRLA